MQVSPPPIVVSTEEVAESAVNSIEQLPLAEAAASVGVITSLISTPSTSSSAPGQTGSASVSDGSSSSNIDEEEEAQANSVQS